jgi:hypothetical protein
MARIPEEELERLKQDVSLERLAESQGGGLVRKGGDLVGLCPSHADKEPSLVITPAKNLWHSIGACRAGGSVIDWVMRAEGVSFRHAAELLQTDYQPSRVSSGSVKRSTVHKLPTAFEGNAEDARLLLQVIECYHETSLRLPEENRTKYSAMTGQALFYMGETDLQHKVLAIVEEEGASTASYALKLLQSEGELMIASAGKDPETGEFKTQDYAVKGPVMIFLTTTTIDIDEELLNRCVVLSDVKAASAAYFVASAPPSWVGRC